MKYSKFNDVNLKEAVANNISASATLRTLNVKAAGGNFKTLYRRIHEQNIDNSHWLGQKHGTTHHDKNTIPLVSILVENSFYNGTQLKKRLIKAGLLKNECEECRLTNWRGKPIVLHLDHINGISSDNRIENLRLLCPNCHSQTTTYCGRNNLITAPRFS